MKQNRIIALSAAAAEETKYKPSREALARLHPARLFRLRAHHPFRHKDYLIECPLQKNTDGSTYFMSVNDSERKPVKQ